MLFRHFRGQETRCGSPLVPTKTNKAQVDICAAKEQLSPPAAAFLHGLFLRTESLWSRNDADQFICVTDGALVISLIAQRRGEERSWLAGCRRFARLPGDDEPLACRCPRFRTALVGTDGWQPSLGADLTLGKIFRVKWTARWVFSVCKCCRC